MCVFFGIVLDRERSLSWSVLRRIVLYFGNLLLVCGVSVDRGGVGTVVPGSPFGPMFFHKG